MKTPSMKFKCSPYVALVKSISQWNHDYPHLKIDPIEEQILYKILIAEYEDEFLCISDLLKSEDIGSQATIHGRIKRLVSLGYVNLIVCDADNRKKIIEPTQKAIDFDQQRSIFLMMAADRNRQSI